MMVARTADCTTVGCDTWFSTDHQTWRLPHLETRQRRVSASRCVRRPEEDTSVICPKTSLSMNAPNVYVGYICTLDISCVDIIFLRSASAATLVYQCYIYIFLISHLHSTAR